MSKNNKYTDDMLTSRQRLTNEHFLARVKKHGIIDEPFRSTQTEMEFKRECEGASAEDSAFNLGRTVQSIHRQQLIFHRIILGYFDDFFELLSTRKEFFHKVQKSGDIDPDYVTERPVYDMNINILDDQSEVCFQLTIECCMPLRSVIYKTRKYQNHSFFCTRDRKSMFEHLNRILPWWAEEQYSKWLERQNKSGGDF